MRWIVLKFKPDPLDPHSTRTWHFAEELYTLLEKDGHGSFPLDAIDKVKLRLEVKVFSKRQTRRVMGLIEQALEKHHLLASTAIDIVVPENGLTASPSPE